MNYSEIYKDEIVNGSGVGVSLFVSGCDLNPHCPGCFNQMAWDFDVGKPFTKEVEDKFLDLASKPYIERISILGGEPLADQNENEIFHLVLDIRQRFGDTKKLWLYSGRTFEKICEDIIKRLILLNIDVLVDGPFIEYQKDLTLPFRGSANQRIIDIPQTLRKGEMVLWDTKN